VTFGTVLVLWAAYTVAFFQFNDATLGRFISNRVEAVDRGKFELKVAHFPYWGGLVSLFLNTPAQAVGEDFELVDPDGGTVIKIPYVATGVHLRELVLSLGKTAMFGGKRFFLTLHFSHARIPSGWGVIAPTASSWGQEKVDTNIVAAMSSKKIGQPPSLGALVIQVDDAELGDLGFAMASSSVDGKPSWWSKIDHLHGKAALLYSSQHDLQTPDGPYFFFRLIDISAPTADLQLGERHFPLEQLTADEFGVHDDVRQELHFAAKARVFNAGVVAGGALVDAYSEHPGVRLTLDVDHGRGPLALLDAPLSTWLGGDPKAHITINGPFTHPVVDGLVKEVDANVEGIRLRHGTAKLHYDDGVLGLHPVGGQVARGEASADVDLELRAPSRWWGTVSLHGVDPAELPHLPKALAAELAGHLDAKVKLSGNLAKHRERIAVSRLGGELVRERGGGHLPRKLTVNGAGEYSPAMIVLKDVTAAGEGVTVAIDGTIDPRDNRVAASLRVDAQSGAALWQRLGAPAGLTVESLHAAGRISGALVKPTLSLHAAAQNVTFSRRTLDHLEADLSLRGGTLVLGNLTASGLGATIAGSAELDLFDGRLDRPLGEPNVRATLETKGLSLGALSGVPLLQGAADGKIELSGPLSHPHGAASLTLPTLSIGGDVYHDGALRVAFTDDGARIDELKLTRVRGGALSGRGTVGWNGELALELKPRDFPLAAIPWLQNAPIAIAGVLSGDVTLGGSADRPIPGGFLSLVGFKVREALLGKGTLKLDPGSDAIHISGNFFGNVSVDGWITLVPKFSVSAVIKFKDLALERFYPEVLELAEVKALATGEAAITIDAESGLTFAKLTLAALTLTLTSTDETGRPQRLVVKNPPDQAVVLTTDGKSLDIKHATLYSSIGEFRIEGTVGGKRNHVYMVGKIGLELLEYFFRGLFEHTHGPAYVELTMSGDLARPEVRGSVQIGSGKGGAAELVPRGLEGKLALRVPSGRVEITPQWIRLSNVVLQTDKDKRAQASGEVQLANWVPGAITGEVHGDLSPKLFQWPLNAYVADANGRLHVDLRIGGVWSHPEWHGSAEVKDVVFHARRVERDVRIDSGTMQFDNFDVALGCPRTGLKPAGCRSLTGMIDDESKIDAVDGRLSIGEEWSLKRLDVWLDGHEIRYAQPGWAISFSPRVQLSGDGSGLTLKGAIDLVEGRYSQNFDVLGLVLRPRTVEAPTPIWEGLPLLETMKLDLRAQSTGSLLVKNNVAELTLSALLYITGVLAEPHLDGTINLEEGGRLSPPGIRYSFETERGTVRFEENKKIPDQTPTIDLQASAPYVDRYEQQHTLLMRLSGTLMKPYLDLTSREGWDRMTVAVILFGGQSPEDFRRTVQGTVSSAAAPQTGSTTDNLVKTASGLAVGQLVSDPLQRVTHFDTVNLQFGNTSVDVKLCKRFGRYLKTCGQGELGFAGASRFGGSIELKLSDRPLEWSGVGRVDYLTHGVETLQDSFTSGGGELRLRFPLGR
jgi:hypothetical protein